MSATKVKPPERMLPPARELQAGDLRVWHIPQVPMSGFHVFVDSLGEAKKVLSILAEYDLFQFERKIKPDYANAQGLEVYVQVSNDGEEDHECYEWEEWMDEQGYNIGEQQ